MKSYKIKPNTELNQWDCGRTTITFYDTDIVTLWNNGNITLDTGGFDTPTTKKRMNDIGKDHGFMIYQEKGK